jgi:carbamoyltransferase
MDIHKRILGVSAYHDSSVCLLEEGEILRYYKEERLSHNKRDQTPMLSLLKIYEEFGEGIDLIVFADGEEKTESLCKKLWRCEIVTPEKSHHLFHASLAFVASGFDKATTIVVDRNGSVFDHMMVESESVFRSTLFGFDALYKSFWRMAHYTEGENLKRSLDDVQEFYPIADIHCDSSFNITQVYETATSLIGENPFDNGKTMGLASYGSQSWNTPNYFVDNRPLDRYFIHLRKQIDMYGVDKINHNQAFNKTYCDLTLNGEIKEGDHKFYADYAYEIQKQTQECLGNLVEKYVKNEESKNVCITGGYGLNVVANSYLVKRFPDYNFYFCPLADDSGNSIGAAISYAMPFTSKFSLMGTMFHGKNYSIPEEYQKCSVDFIADQLCNQKSVAVFNGLAEAGPRALGNRSILFDATNKDAKEIVNRIKNREWYRPFAAICLREDADELFEMVDTVNSDYMTMSFDVKSARIPGVTHVDNTCRIQTISEDHHLYTLLKSIKQRIGIGVLLNTSFNMAGKPLVESLANARKTFYNSAIDILWFPKTNQFIMKE